MISVDMFSLWGDDIDEIVVGITEATNNIAEYMNVNNPNKEQLFDVCNDVKTICAFWTGNMYVGIHKANAVKEAFQVFFETLMNFLLSIKENGNPHETKLAKSLLYRGTVYRYLGSREPTKEVIAPLYDNIYVSWSKNQKNSYVEGKLIGSKTWLSCKISDPLYGIDLEALGCSKGEEREVVFPTIKECITEIKFILEEDDD